jgi:hypothetical protein
MSKERYDASVEGLKKIIGEDGAEVVMKAQDLMVEILKFMSENHPPDTVDQVIASATVLALGGLFYAFVEETPTIRLAKVLGEASSSIFMDKMRLMHTKDMPDVNQFDKKVKS